MPRFARCVFAVFLAVSCLSSSLTCQAAAPETAAAAFILMEAGSGRVLASRNETQERSIASTTKIMTCLVALEHSELTEKVTVKREHLREGSSMYLLEGETLTMEELLYGLMLPSGNDAAECIAAHCGGSGGSAQFVRWMNEKAKALGMEHTSFANPSGLDEMGHSSCALDMARLAAYAMQNPTFARIVSTRTASVGTRTMTNHNKLLASYSGCIGLKTGYTGDAGRTPSGNDAAECIAAHCGGSGGSAQFVRWMNEKAKALGMEHTSFANPSGLDEMGHSSCALDMARLAAYAMQNPTFARIVSTRTASVGTRTMTNHNKLLASYSGCIGLKTGYTGDAGRTLVTCAERGGMRMIAVTLHDGSDWADHAALYDYGFSAYALSSGAKKGEAYGSVSVDGQSVSAMAAESFRYPTAENEALSVHAELPQTVSAPVRKGQTFGTLVISCGETEVGRVDLVSARSVQAQETKSETSKNKSLAEKLWQFLSAK